LRSIAGVDFDKNIAALVACEAQEISSAKTASTRVAQLLNLRNFLRAIPAICQTLQGSSANLLRIVMRMLDDTRLGRLEKIISDSLNEDALPQKVVDTKSTRDFKQNF